MVLSAPIPPDIVNEIIDYIRDDTVTLKYCSVVSPIFYQLTRQHLFANITLGQPEAVSSLNHTISRNPQISAYIRSLNIPYPFRSTLRKIMAILPMLTHVRHLILGVNGFYTMIPDFPRFFPSISALLKLQHLERLEIYSIEGFPASFLHIPQQLKWLTLEKTRVDTGSVVEMMLSPLLHLRMVHLNQVSLEVDNAESSFLHAPNFRQLVIGVVSGSIQPFIEAGVKTIENVVWYQYLRHFAYPMIDLGILRNLRRLSFITATEYGPFNSFVPPPTWNALRDMLCTGFIARRLEELNLIIKTSQVLTSAYIKSLLEPLDIWVELADRLRYPRLKSVTIRLDVTEFSPSISENDFRSVITQTLPFLEEATCLRVTLCKDFDWNDLILKCPVFNGRTVKKFDWVLSVNRGEQFMRVSIWKISQRRQSRNQDFSTAAANYALVRQWLHRAPTNMKSTGNIIDLFH